MTIPCTLVKLPVRRDLRGALAFAEAGKQLSFEVRREFHLFDFKAGVARGGHAHKTCHQFLVAMAGTFLVVTDDGKFALEWTLNSPEQGLHVPPGHWVDIVSLADVAVLSVLASHTYDEADYIRHRAEFISYVHSS
jgi:dTDP-4-dehydrorhamnose 3,5-epimerase-like enzyme